MKHLIALILSQSGIAKYNNIILLSVEDSIIPIDKRDRILSNWSSTLCASQHTGAYRVINRIDNKTAATKLTVNEIERLYKIMTLNTELSPQALALLINFEHSIERLSIGLKSFLPELKYVFKSNRVTLINMENLKNLAFLLNPWLSQQLRSYTWKNHEFLLNCIQFSGIFGDYRVLESIMINRERILESFISDKTYLIHIEHLIRTSAHEIRLYLEDHF